MILLRAATPAPRDGNSRVVGRGDDF